MNFQEIGPAYTSVIEISKKYWMSFPENRLCHTPGNWNFGKISGWVFQDLTKLDKNGISSTGDSFFKVIRLQLELKIEQEVIDKIKDKI